MKVLTYNNVLVSFYSKQLPHARSPVFKYSEKGWMLRIYQFISTKLLIHKQAYYRVWVSVGSPSGITSLGARLQGVVKAAVLHWVFSDGITCWKFVVGSWWREFGLVVKAHGSALWQNDLMAGKSWMATLWLWLSIISSFCCWNWHWGKWWDLRLKFSPDCFLFMSIQILFCRYFLKWIMTYKHFTEVLSLSV